jgi:peptide deformylase
MIYKIIKHPHPLLRENLKPVLDFTSIQVDIRNMIETMKYERGIGLAANQIGINKSLFVAMINGEPKAFINPRIHKSGKCIMSVESCLSLPGITRTVPRAPLIKIMYQTTEGIKSKNFYEGMNAIVCQHELEHCKGVLIIDYK